VTSEGKVSIFPFKGTPARAPLTGVIVDAKRQVLYGTTAQAKIDHGDVFRVDAHGRGRVLYTFCQQPACADGVYPGGLVEDQSGNLFGATQGGGALGEGVVFEIIP